MNSEKSSENKKLNTKEKGKKGKKGKGHEEEGPELKVSRSLMIIDEQHQNPLASFLKEYKEATIPRIAALNTEETELSQQSSEYESSDDSQSSTTQTSSEDEIHMAIPGVKTEEDDPMDTDASPSTSAPPPF
ncbi:hypothetical protein V6N11_053541 [Hibiscus sabdariffa]|uniref:Uncharacterized protein n=1 Tax=Hibiscus sabdariffa TaxID=183260 RepID=A0ABR2UDK3_9ROSI